MPRWKEDSRSRLEQAALSLFAEQGYDATSVAEIAHGAGLTERSFYRWFPDKREVLFAESQLSEVLLQSLQAVPSSVEPLPALLVALASAEQVLRPREFLVRRAAVIASTPALRERELSKLHALARVLVDGLVQRGCPRALARLAVDAGMAIMGAATQQWIEDEDVPLSQALAANAARLKEIASTIGS